MDSVCTILCIFYRRILCIERLNKLESVKIKLESNYEKLINTAFLAKITALEFAPNRCKKSYIKNAFKRLISCGVDVFYTIDTHRKLKDLGLKGRIFAPFGKTKNQFPR